MEFKEIIKKEEIIKVIEESGFTMPTPIQEQTIPLIKEGFDVLGQSTTGTGKTLAFAAPILDNIEENSILQAIILAPTRELAVQIEREIDLYSSYMNINTVCVYGSSSIENQIKIIKKGIEIVIGTPGRVKDLLNRKVLKLSNLKFFVLDEADEMLSMGFQEDIEEIFSKTNKEKQVLLFSATMPISLKKIVDQYMKKDYKTISVIDDIKTAEHIKQNYYLVNDNTRVEAMCRILDFYNTQRTMIFVRTKRNADDLYTKLRARGYKVEVIHGDIVQSQRIATLDSFKNGEFTYLIATDVAARGIHVADIEIVINYNLPESHESYIHRIGRTGRVDKEGLAITFIKPSEEKIIKSLENYIHTPIIKSELPEVDDILKNRLEEEIEKIKSFDNQNNLFDEYLNKLSNEEIKQIANTLLTNDLLSSIGLNKTIKIEKTTSTKQNKKNKRNTEDSIRVFLTIGKMDNITKRDLLLFIEKKANIKEGTCTGVEILSKFTFMNIQKDKYEQVLKACNNANYNGRTIRIEKAKK